MLAVLSIICCSFYRFFFVVSLTDVCLFFFFKQKTAYEMRISDWSSDVCSSDLILLASHQTNVGFAWDDIGDLINVTAQHREITSDTRRAGIGNGFTVPAHVPGEANGSCNFAVRTGREQIGRASCRERVCQYV